MVAPYANYANNILQFLCSKVTCVMTLSFYSYITSTYVIEAMAAANAYCKAKEKKRAYTYINGISGSNGDVTTSYMEQMSSTVHDSYHRVEDDDDAVRNGTDC